MGGRTLGGRTEFERSASERVDVDQSGGERVLIERLFRSACDPVKFNRSVDGRIKVEDACGSAKDERPASGQEEVERSAGAREPHVERSAGALVQLERSGG